MDEDENEFLPPTRPIPEEFYSAYEDRPFRSCTRCGESLTDFREGYQVAKVMKGGEAIFEYALCGPCHLGLLEEFSEESRKALESFYSKNMTPGLGADICGLCQKPKDELQGEEYALGAACLGEGMLEAFMVCAPCLERANALVSKKTQGIWDQFIEDNFPGVAADCLPGAIGVALF